MTADSRAQTLVLPAQLTIAGVAALRPQLLAAAAEPNMAEIDASAVTEADTAGLQLLAAFVRDRQRSAARWRWIQPTQPLRRAAALLGLDRRLALPPPEDSP